jgi:hypothetical protein
MRFAVPRELVVEHHGVPHQRLQRRHPMPVAHDVVVGVDGIVGVVGEQPMGELAPIAGERARHRGPDRQLRRRPPGGARDVEERAEDVVLGGGVPRRRKGVIPGPEDVDEAVGAGGPDHGEEDVVAVARDVSPAGRALLVHRDRVAVHPAEVEREVPEELVSCRVAAGVEPADDEALGRGPARHFPAPV